jgi:hypothetical protein
MNIDLTLDYQTILRCPAAETGRSPWHDRRNRTDHGRRSHQPDALAPVKLPMMHRVFSMEACGKSVPEILLVET